MKLRKYRIVLGKAFTCEDCENYHDFYPEENGSSWGCEAGEEANGIMYAEKCKYFVPEVPSQFRYVKKLRGN